MTKLALALVVGVVLYWPLLIAAAGAEYLRWLAVQQVRKWSKR